MDTLNLDKDCSALEALFQSVMTDMKTGYPILEDFSVRASKLHTALRTTIVALGSFLEAFQKVADMATNTRGATRDIGAALTRLCIRHKNIDAKLRAFNGAILECLVTPLQEKIEEWKRTSGQMDKDHMKEYKKVRADWKKASENTLKLQKKAKKGKASMNTQLEAAIKDYTNKYQVMEDSCQGAARQALMEERSRYCNLVSFLKPVLLRELSMIQEIGHLQEIVTNLSQQTSDPQALPPASEQVILDTTKGSEIHKSFQPDYVSELTLKLLHLEKTPPSSPSSLGSRKSSMCSISSVNSSSSNGSKPHSSPAHHCRPRTVSQQVPASVACAVTPRQTSVSSQDSGFTSQDHIPLAAPGGLKTSPNESQSSHTSIGDADDAEAKTPSSDYQQWAEARPDSSQPVERPHTISSAYERAHARPQLTSYTFEAPDAKTPTNNDAVSVPTTPSQYARPFVAARRGSIRDSMVQDKPPTGPRPRSKMVPLPSVPNSGQAIYANVDDIMNSTNHAGDTDFANNSHLRKMSLPATSADLARAIEELDAQTQALNDEESLLVTADNNSWQCPSPNNTNKMPNSLELAEAIRELEANTASLQSSCGPNAHKSIMSLQCSSGYATMTNTPASSDDTIASGGMSATLGGLAAIRRGSLPSKPPPPVRRSSSHSGPSGDNNGVAEEVTYASPHSTPTQHRRANSVSVAGECHYYPSTQSEHGTSASGSIPRRTASDQDAQIYATAQVVQPGPMVTPPRARCPNVPPPTIYAYATPPRMPGHPNQMMMNQNQNANSEQHYSPKVQIPVPPPGPAVNTTPPRGLPTMTSTSTPNTPKPDSQIPQRQCVSNPNTPKVNQLLVRSQASVIDTLNQKFAVLNRTDSIDDLPLPPMPDELLPPPPESQTNSPGSMLSQIREGVQLRKVNCNDRSQPKL